MSEHLAGEIEELRARIQQRLQEADVPNDLPDNREAWMIRWISMHEEPKTAAVLAARKQIQSDETQASLSTALKKLEKKGWLTSTKEGKELHWTATDDGKEVMG